MGNGSDEFGGDASDGGDAPRDPRAWRLVFERLFDPHPSSVALVALDGVVLAVNRAWREYGRANGVAAGYEFVGQNYLAVCEAGAAAGDTVAQSAYVGLLDVIRQGRPKFTLVYACPLPTGARTWFRMWVEPQTPSVPAVIVAHQPVPASVGMAEGGQVAEHWVMPPTGRVDAVGRVSVGVPFGRARH